MRKNDRYHQCSKKKIGVFNSLSVHGKCFQKWNKNFIMTKYVKSSTESCAKLTVFQVTEKLHQHEPEGMLGNENGKFLWNFSVNTDRVIPHRWSAVIFVNEPFRMSYYWFCFINRSPDDNERVGKNVEIKAQLTQMRKGVLHPGCPHRYSSTGQSRDSTCS